MSKQGGRQGSSRDRDRQRQDYAAWFRRNVLDKLTQSHAAVIPIMSNDPTKHSIIEATEIGLTLMMGKPLLVIVAKGNACPAGLRRAADELVLDYDHADAKSQAELKDALGRLALMGMEPQNGAASSD